MQTKLPEGIRVLFVAGFGPVVADRDKSDKLYRKVLALPLRHEDGYEGYWHSQCIEGVKHFALWPLDKAALSCFGEPTWPANLPVPKHGLSWTWKTTPISCSALLPARSPACTWTTTI